MEPEPTEDPLHALVAEAVTRADGRYLIYYSWPGRGDEAEAPAQGAHDPNPVADV